MRQLGAKGFKRQQHTLPRTTWPTWTHITSLQFAWADSLLILFFFSGFTYLFESSHREGRGQSDIVKCANLPLKWPVEGWAKHSQEPGTWSRSCKGLAGAQASFAALPGAPAGNWATCGAASTQADAQLGCGWHRWCLSQLCHSCFPVLRSLSSVHRIRMPLQSLNQSFSNSIFSLKSKIMAYWYCTSWHCTALLVNVLSMI